MRVLERHPLRRLRRGIGTPAAAGTLAGRRLGALIAHDASDSLLALERLAPWETAPRCWSAVLAQLSTTALASYAPLNRVFDLFEITGARHRRLLLSGGDGPCLDLTDRGLLGDLCSATDGSGRTLAQQALERLCRTLDVELRATERHAGLNSPSPIRSVTLRTVREHLCERVMRRAKRERTLERVLPMPVHRDLRARALAIGHDLASLVEEYTWQQTFGVALGAQSDSDLMRRRVGDLLHTTLIDELTAVERDLSAP